MQVYNILDHSGNLDEKNKSGTGIECERGSYFILDVVFEEGLWEELNEARHDP